MLAISLVSSWIKYTGFTLSCLIIMGVIFWVWVWLEVKHDLDKNKKDMYICPKHGTFPKESAMYYEFTEPSNKPLRVPRCPVCMQEDYANMRDIVDRKTNILPWKGKSA